MMTMLAKSQHTDYWKLTQILFTKHLRLAEITYCSQCPTVSIRRNYKLIWKKQNKTFFSWFKWNERSSEYFPETLTQPPVLLFVTLLSVLCSLFINQSPIITGAWCQHQRLWKFSGYLSVLEIQWILVHTLMY